MPVIFPAAALGDVTWNWSRTCILGVVNVTPDSFFDGGRHQDTDQAVSHALEMVRQGAHVVDVGGESTRPGAAKVSVEEELSRVIPVIEGIRASSCEAPISIDTYKARVAREAVAAGASLINDISGMLLDRSMPAVVAETGAVVILGHLRGEPASMMEEITFSDVVSEVIEELRGRVRAAVEAGVGPESIWIDPGIGFGKTAQQSLELLKATGRIREEVGYPILVGPSRKSFIGAVTAQPPEERLMGTAAAVSAVVLAGADAVRIHDVGELAPAVQIADAIHRRGGA